jgi:hypothetical protein
LETLRGDQGARSLLADAAEKARCDFFELGDPAICADNDLGRLS